MAWPPTGRARRYTALTSDRRLAVADDPSLFDQFEQWYANSRDAEALDPKTKALVGLAVVLTGNCQP